MSPLHHHTGALLLASLFVPTDGWYELVRTWRIDVCSCIRERISNPNNLGMTDGQLRPRSTLQASLQMFAMPAAVAATTICMDSLCGPVCVFCPAGQPGCPFAGGDPTRQDSWLLSRAWRAGPGPQLGEKDTLVKD